jgi:hypothetical protein
MILAIELFLMATIAVYLGLFNAYVIKWKLKANSEPEASKKASKRWHSVMWWTKISIHLMVLFLTWGLSLKNIIATQLITVFFTVVYYDLLINAVNFDLFYIDRKGINVTLMKVFKKDWIFWAVKFLVPLIGVILIMI